MLFFDWFYYLVALGHSKLTRMLNFVSNFLEQNLLLSANDDKSILKIADFGFAR